MTLSIEDHAIRLASHGWCVIPVLGKVPVGTEWQKRASNDPAKIAREFSTHRHDGLGVQLGERSNLIDFDIDNQEAEETLQRLFDGKIPKTPSFQSTRGKHYLFRWTDRLPQGKIKIVVDGLEIRLGNGDKGCQSVLPPSGDRSWLIDPDDCPLAEIPAIVIDKINLRHAELNRPKAIRKQAGFSTDRDDSSESLNVPRWLNRNGREIIGRTDGTDGVTRFHIECPGVVYHTTQNSPRDCCITQDATGKLGGTCFHSSCGMHSWERLRAAIGPLTWEDYHEPVDMTGVDVSAIMAEPEPAPVIVIPEQTDDDFDDDDDLDSPPELIDLGFPRECLQPPGFISEFSDYVLKTAKYPQPEHTLGAALGFMSLLTGRRVAASGGVRGNLMIVSLGPTRSGKEYPRKILKNILAACNASKMFEEKIASEAALYGFLKESPSGLWINDEFGDWLALARSKGGANTQPARILTAMTMLYSSSDTIFKAPRYAENSKQVEVNQPNLAFLGTSTGEIFWKHVTPDYLAGGLFGRMLLIEGCGYVDPQPSENTDQPLPESLINQVKAWLRFMPVRSADDDLGWVNPSPILVPSDTDARDRLRGHEMDISKRRKGEDPIRAALWSGTAEISRKLALLFACSRCMNPLQITIEDVDLAIKLANWLTRRKISLCSDHVAENAAEDQAKRVVRLIKSSGINGISRQKLCRKTQWLKKRERDELMAGLLEMGIVRLTEVHTPGRMKVVYTTSTKSQNKA